MTGAELKDFLTWCRAQKIQQVKLGDDTFTFSNLAMVDAMPPMLLGETREPSIYDDFTDPLETPAEYQPGEMEDREKQRQKRKRAAK